MGKFTNSYIVVGSTGEALVAFYQAQGTRAFIFQDDDNHCVICDDNDDEADLDLIAELTDKLHAIALVGQVFDSSTFVGTIYNQGTAIDEYIDYPEYSLDSWESVLYLNRDLSVEQRATEWTSLFNAAHNSDALADVFRRRAEYVFAEDFYEALLEALALPTVMVGATYWELERAYETDAEARQALLHVSSEFSESE